MTLLYPITSWLSVVTREAMQRCREEARAGRVCRALMKERMPGSGRALGHPEWEQAGSALGPSLWWEGAWTRGARVTFLLLMAWSGAHSIFFSG